MFLTLITYLHKRWQPASFAFTGTAQLGEGRSVLAGPLFRQFLSQERKRSERSGNSSLLVVLRVGDGAYGAAKSVTLTFLRDRLFSRIRDTDVMGWHDEEQSELGILFTEIAEPNPTAVPVILKRVREMIAAHSVLEAPAPIACRVFRDGESKYVVSLEPRAMASD